MELLIDRDGRSRQAPREASLIADAVLKRGLIYIRSIECPVVIWLEPHLVNPKTLAGAFYAIADMRPPRVIVRAGAGAGVEVWHESGDMHHALVRIEQLITRAHHQAASNAATGCSKHFGSGKILAFSTARESSGNDQNACSSSGRRRRDAQPVDLLRTRYIVRSEEYGAVEPHSAHFPVFPH